jgi:hypothetical protein
MNRPKAGIRSQFNFFGFLGYTDCQIASVIHLKLSWKEDLKSLIPSKKLIQTLIDFAK